MSRRVWIAVSAVAVVLVAGFAAWWFLLRSDAPDPVSLESAVEAVTSTTGAASSAQGEVPDAGGTGSGTEAPKAETDGISGSWTVRADGTSFVGYRVNEELASIGVTTAAGRTPLVEGSLQIEGTTVTAVDIEADLRGLESDDSRRDGAIRRQALETERFPTASFTLSEPIELPSGAESGAPVSITGLGELTLHGVTRQIRIPLEAQLVDGAIVVIGSAPVLFDDYEIEKPSAAIVLSVDDEGIMEFQLVFEGPG